MTCSAIYARYSSNMQREASIEDQVRLCRERARQEGWSVLESFTDMALSGASMHRPGLQSLIDAAERGQIDIVISEALDRLSRDQADVAVLYKRLSFFGVRIVTLAEGEISELHVGLKGTMNQLFLKDLADKTRRGLRGRVEAGRSAGGNAYGYDVVRQMSDDGAPITGERKINADEAQIVRRIFQAFADGNSPKVIARLLNADGIPGPRGKLWRDTAIRGHRQRGTGILNNEMYVGRLVWNRLRYRKDPETGKRVSRLNPDEDWIIKEIPELRIIDDALWERAKARQKEIDATPRVQGIRASRFWEHKRKTHLLTGLLRCGSCGGGLASVGKDYLACSAARKLGSCDQRRGFRREQLETAVLDLLRERLMQPDAVAEFIKAFTAEMDRQRGSKSADRTRMEKELDSLHRALDGLYNAIAEGLRTPGLQARLEEMEARKATLEADLEAPASPPVRMHPNLSELYRNKVADLSASLADPKIRVPALEIIRSLIDQVTLHVSAKGKAVLELEGVLSAMIEAAQPGALHSVDHGSVEVVAGVGFEPTTFRL